MQKIKYPTIALLSFLAIACAANPRRLECVSIKSEALEKKMHYTVLYPPGLKRGQLDEDMHIVYLLHGYGGDHRSLDRKGLSDIFLRAWADGKIPKAVLVMPNGERGFYLNWHDGSKRYEDYIIDEVIPDAERYLGVEPTRARRHIAGVSMGGYGALLLALRHPDLFESAASISGVIFDREKAIDLTGKKFLHWTIDIDRMLGDGSDSKFLEAHNPYSLLEKLSEQERPRLFLAYGSKEPEPIRRPSLLFHDYLQKKGVEHEWFVYDGSHDWPDWAPAIERAISFSVGVE